MIYCVMKRAAAGALLAAGLATGAFAFPDKPVDYVIPFGPGGESDISARLQQPFFKEKFGQDLVVSYKEGGGGAVGWSQLNGLSGDGHTIMGVNLPHIVLQPAEKDVGYKTDDLVTIYWFHFTPDAIVVRADSEFKTLDDFLKYAKDNPGGLTIGGTGKGSANHLAQVKFDELAGIKTAYVPFKGTGAVTTATLGGQIMAQWGYTTVGAAQGDQVRLLAVATEERHPLFPDVPTFKELGYDLIGGAWRGIAVPSSVPEEQRKQWSNMIAEINADPDFRKKMEEGGFAMADVPYEEEKAWLAKQKEAYIQAAKDAGILK
ncbi:MAG: tripartite tricarboxylate transporter substrate binding protein [Rhizobiaceae bacterium]|nr:tripartite tricarboxylate transporter substrate binding protein [Rhizobiaceae bacterium]MCV0408784.1 tripartite tricarboxylate transporter substrate binding protein [Rhizobiaceae bacterium]